MSPLSELFRTKIVPPYKAVDSRSEYLSMRDGTQIAADILLPAGLPAGAKIPALMIMARYWRSMDLHVGPPPKKAPIGPRASRLTLPVVK